MRKLACVKKAFVGMSLVCAFGFMQADESGGFLSFEDTKPKECKTEQDKITGCAVIEDYGDQGGSITPYKNGKIHGIVEWFDPTGFSKTPYVNGKIEGIEEEALGCEGEPLIEIPYKNDRRSGEGKFFKYDTNKRKLIGTITFQNDKAVSGKCTNGKNIPQAALQKANGSDYCPAIYACY